MRARGNTNIALEETSTTMGLDRQTDKPTWRERERERERERQRERERERDCLLKDFL